MAAKRLPRIASAWDDLPQIAISGGALVSARLCRLPEQEVHQPSKQRFSHRFHRSTQMVRVRKILPQIAQNSQNLLLGIASHRLHRSTQIVWVRKILPRIAQNSQKLLLGMSSHRFHRFAQMVRLRKIVAEVSLPPQQQSASHRLHRCNFRGCTCLKCTNQANSGPPTDCTEFTEPSAGETSHRLHRFTQKLLILGGCTCLRSALPLARARSAPTEQYRYISCYVGALETSAPP